MNTVQALIKDDFKQDNKKTNKQDKSCLKRGDVFSESIIYRNYEESWLFHKSRLKVHLHRKRTVVLKERMRGGPVQGFVYTEVEMTDAEKQAEKVEISHVGCLSVTSCW